MRFAVVDDESAVLELLPVQLASLLPDDTVTTDCFHNAQEFISAYHHTRYDALFLDIDMPDMNGFELSEHLRNQHDGTPIIFITARDDLMIHAFRYKALGFVRKSNIHSELPYAMTSILRELGTKENTIEITEVRAAGGKTHTIKLIEIEYIEAVRNNVYIHLVNGHALTVRSTLADFRDRADFSGFVQISSGIIVNLSRMKLSDTSVQLESGLSLPISKRRLTEVRLAYLNYIKGVLI